MLKIKEQSILTQDKRIPLMQESTVRRMQPNFGEMYAKRAKEAVGILDGIECALGTCGLKKSIQDDLIALKSEYRQLLAEYIDEFAYKVLSNIDRDMLKSSLTVRRYDFNSDIFKMQIYTQIEMPQSQLYVICF